MEKTVTNTTSAPQYRIRVRNFGPISKGRVDLKPLTIFVGPSNTGKSYLATLIYALQRALRDSDGYPRGPELHGLEPDFAVMEALGTWAVKSVDASHFRGLPEEVTVFLRSLVESARGLDRRVDTEISHCFGVNDMGRLVRFPRARMAHIGLAMTSSDGLGQLDYEIRLKKGSTRVTGKIRGKTNISKSFFTSRKHRFLQLHISRLARDWLVHQDDDIEQLRLEYAKSPRRSSKRLYHHKYALHSLAEALRNRLLADLPRNTHYLPADRTGVMHGHKVVVSALVRNAATAGIRHTPEVPMLSGVLADFLDALIRIPATGDRRRAATTRVLARDLEGLVLGGSVHAKLNETDYPEFFYRPDGWKQDLPLMRASSMVSELAPVVLYLRHIVRPGDLLIIEEPEAHLHPAKQVELVRQLARVVASGVKVIVTTHSSWVLEQFGNLVGLSHLEESERAGMHTDVALSPNDVGGWLFSMRGENEGSVIEEIEIDPDTGLFPTDHDAVSNALYNESAMIFNRLQEGSEE